MLDIVKTWIDRYFSEEEAVLVFVLLLGISLSFLFMGQILAPVLTGVVLAFVMQGIINFMRQYSIPKLVAVWVTFFLFLGGFVGFLFLLVPRIWRQLRSLYQDLPNLSQQLGELVAQLLEDYPALISERQIDSWIGTISTEAADIGQWLLSASISQLPIVITIFIYVLLVPILVFFFLKDKEQVLAWMLNFLPEKRPLMNKIGSEMNAQMENYIRGKFAELLLVGLITYLLFAVFDLNYAALLGFLVGLSVIVPYLGFVAVTLPVTIIAFMQFGWSEPFLYLMMTYGLIQALDGFLLVPLLFSEANNLHPLAIIIAVLVFGSWFGVWGVFFAIPLATLIKAIVYAWPKDEMKS